MALERNILQTAANEDIKEIADAFNIEYKNVRNHPAHGAYIIDIEHNEDAQKIYKKLNPHGNGFRPSAYDFSKEIIVTWTGTKINFL